MARLKSSERSKLPASAFAYIDSKGGRRLPIHDEAHVRAALARFGRVSFEDDAARERARKRLLNAAKKYGIVPVGFITGQLRSEREHAVAGNEVQARSTDPATLPTGFVTFLLTDIEGSTALLTKLGDGYAGLLNDVRAIVRDAVTEAGGREVDARADEFFAVFEEGAPAIQAAVAFQRVLTGRTWPDDLTCQVRAGIHSGRPTLTDTGYIGLSVHTAARVCAAAHGGQIVVSGKTRKAAEGSVPAGVRFRSLGRYRLQGLSQAETLYQVDTEGLAADFPPLRAAAAPSPARRR
ncbi:MAG: adenylate/guanylate cyclase domain-containing protein [Actinobacteria bacterium]|nr:MAG: adenylate/guanylate cyclase domain-containing protein [Actinomycetota bacterium]